MAGKFHTPKINNFQIPQQFGQGNPMSGYLFNNYQVDFDPAWWRRACDQAIQYSNLVYLDMMYSWCMQSSPFLVSQVNKRITPLFKREFAIEKNGRISRILTEKYVKTTWFREIMRLNELSQFYGAKCFSLDPQTMEVTDFPLRNLDIFNKGLRRITYGYDEIVTIKDYDNLFFIEPTQEQDFRLGLMQPISRLMIQIMQAYNNWNMYGRRCAYQMMSIGYAANNTEAKEVAKNIADNIDLMSSNVIPFTNNPANGGASVYQVELNPVNSQSYPDAFRNYKEIIETSQSEIMQLVTGGTLLGATEKNTNSEQLAKIHLQMYRDVLDGDIGYILSMMNGSDFFEKLSRTLKDPRLEGCSLVEIPSNEIGIDDFRAIGDTAAKMGIRFTAEAFAKVGLDPAKDIDQVVHDKSWVNTFDVQKAK